MTKDSADYHISPLPGFILATPLEENKVGTIHISDSMAIKDSAGVVVAVGDPYIILEGPQNLVVEPPVKVGDKIIFSNFVRPQYMDFKTGKHIYAVKFSPDPRYSEIVAIIGK